MQNNNDDFQLLLEQDAYFKMVWNIQTQHNELINTANAFFGFSKDEIKATPNFLTTICSEKGLIELNELLSNANNLNSRFNIEIKIKDKDQVGHWIKLFGYTKVKNDNSLDFHCFIKDITDQYNTKIALHKSEIEKAQILDSIIDGAVYITPDLKIKYANKTFIEKHPKYSGNLEGQPCYKVIHNLDNPCISCSVKKVLDTKKYQTTVRSIINGPSTQTITYPVFDHKENIIGSVVTFRDITESKNIERALKKEAMVNKNIAELSQEILKPDTTEEIISKKILGAALSLTKSSTGYAASLNNDNKDITIKAFENYSLKTTAKINNACHHGIDHPNCISTFLNNKSEPFLSNKLKQFVIDNNLEPCEKIRENGLMVPAIFNNQLIGQIYVSGSERPLSDNDIYVIKQLANIYAISIFRNNSEKELIKAKEEAEESNKLKTAFLANMSHEIRTPMNAINGFSELLRNTHQTEEMRNKYLEIIYKSSNQLLNIINNILDISKLDIGQAKITLNDFDLNQIILDSIQSFNPEVLKEEKLELITHLALHNSDSIIKCDGHRLQQVITNLIQNAIKFTHDGKIEVGYNIIDDQINVYVKDTGIGIKKQNLKLIFERFGQAEEGYSRNFEGAGLGLSICKGFVELMGGKIWVDSEIDKGSNFQFTIPYNPVNENRTLNENEINDQNYNWKGKKILLVEDEAFSQNFMETILLPHGVKMIYANTGFEALNQIRLNQDIDLVLMDVRLPGMDGIEVTKKVRLLGFNKPIIAQTANALPDDKKLCIEAGCNFFVSKPIERLNFLKIINNYLS